MERLGVRLSVLALFLVIAVYTLQGCGEMDNPSQGMSDGDMAAFAGRVVDTDGRPVAQLSLFMQYIRSDNEGLRPKFDSFLKAETDEAGHFSITNISPGQLQLVLVPYYDRHRYDDMKYEVISIKIGEVIYYPNEPSPYSRGYQSSFSITAGARVEDVEVTVKTRMRIRGKVVFKDGTPLTKWPIYLKTQYKGFKGGSSSYGGPIHTDADGFFTRYVSGPGLYTVTVRYQELTATSEQFTLNDGEHRENLVLTFDSVPVPFSVHWHW
jgi:hypothetical protein